MRIVGGDRTTAQGAPYGPTEDRGIYRSRDGGANWDKLVLSAAYYPDDFDAASNNPEFPIEWGNVLVWGLAAELASEYGLPEREQGRIWQVAEFKLNEMLAFDVENASVILGMDIL